MCLVPEQANAKYSARKINVLDQLSSWVVSQHQAEIQSTLLHVGSGGQNI